MTFYMSKNIAEGICS